MDLLIHFNIQYQNCLKELLYYKNFCRIVAMLLTGRCPFLVDSSSLSILQYNINTSGALSALVRCTVPDDNETYVIECGMNGQWNTDITDNCSSSNPKFIQTTISEHYNK